MRYVLLVMFALSGCGKGDPQKCDQACRNYGTLMFWKVADAEIEKAPVDQREALRKAKVVELASKLESGVTFCVSKCQSANNEEQMKCMIGAKTADVINKCADTEQQFKDE
ncbi:MAG: hypothetical protein H0T79_20165 [Deltaproteobacteria bacterium]|nr:hypothetical protein [Deltaproteobacteria bacterium]